ncbi:hypothetical protein RIR_jg20650.t1 [Rhizophagus irregularis DAOM 181602=DAOM 197198]|uniref:Uncharacterized protein n=2 Tax=Rhizophagus irregularis TaxID=588596 RepID=A0A015LQN5_RHIIW|nr:hypothetical protein RirG_045440 [Rhizophagus irregularis DAOM 197198w]GBC46577.1 hypothetical protein RIR_jg20650.t1 [Rhizophagus irregularis DAOM 181602=DAOM 197198]CAG8523069.1 8707_t:CDS:2 [Rhizophagus irregularis]
MKKVYTKSSCRYDEPCLSYNDNVRYLLKPSEFEELFDGPGRRFVREELLLVNDGVELPPESILRLDFK